MTAPAIQVSMSGVEARATPARLALLRRRFLRRRVVRLPALLEPELASYVDRRLRCAGFREASGPYERRQVPADRGVDALLPVLFSDEALFRFVESVTGCPRIARVTGGIFRSRAERHFLDWHGDVDDGRRVAAMTVNLSAKPFLGGRLELRRRGARRLLASVPYKKRGEALLMAIKDGLVHRSTPVRGARPKLVFTCFFYRRQVRRRAAASLCAARRRPTRRRDRPSSGGRRTRR